MSIYNQNIGDNIIPSFSGLCLHFRKKVTLKTVSRVHTSKWGKPAHILRQIGEHYGGNSRHCHFEGLNAFFFRRFNYAVN